MLAQVIWKLAHGYDRREGFRQWIPFGTIVLVVKFHKPEDRSSIILHNDNFYELTAHALNILESESGILSWEQSECLRIKLD